MSLLAHCARLQATGRGTVEQERATSCAPSVEKDMKEQQAAEPGVDTGRQEPRDASTDAPCPGTCLWVYFGSASLGFCSSSHLLFVIFSEQDQLLIHVYTATSTTRPWSCLRPLGMTIIQMINHHNKTGLHRSISSVITRGWSVSSSQTHGKVRETRRARRSESTQKRGDAERLWNIFNMSVLYPCQFTADFLYWCHFQTAATWPG